MDLEKKLKSFEESCLSLASDEATELKKEIEAEIESQMKVELDEYTKRKEWNYEKTVKKIEKDYMKDVFKIQNECKIEILNAKNAIYNDLKQEVINRLVAFTNLEQYREYLINMVKKSLEYTNTEDKVFLGLTKKDIEKFSSQIEEIRNFEIIEIEEKYLGGCTLKTDNIFIDNTLLNSIEEKMMD